MIRASGRRESVLALLLALPVGCSAPSGVSLPILSKDRAYAPVEGLESPELAAHARCAVLSASREKPIAVLRLPSGARRDHPVRGEVVGLAGPARDGRFVYVVRDERAGAAIRRAHVDGADLFVARFARPIHALSVSADGERAAILAPFPEGDARSRGGVLRELVTVDLSAGDVRETGFAVWNAAPAWTSRASIACVVAAPDGSRSIALLDADDPASARVLAAGDAVLADPPLHVIAFRRDEDGLRAARVAVADAGAQDLVLRGGLQPLGLAGDGLLVAFSAPTLGAEPQWELDLFGPQVALATIKLHDLATGSFHTLEPRASPRRLWSAGRLDP